MYIMVQLCVDISGKYSMNKPSCHMYLYMCTVSLCIYIYIYINYYLYSIHMRVVKHHTFHVCIRWYFIWCKVYIDIGMEWHMIIYLHRHIYLHRNRLWYGIIYNIFLKWYTNTEWCIHVYIYINIHIYIYICTDICI